VYYKNFTHQDADKYSIYISTITTT